MVSFEDYVDDFIQIQTIYFATQMLHQRASMHNPIFQTFLLPVDEISFKTNYGM